MKDLLEIIPYTEWLTLNAKLQQKKSAARKALSELGVLKREGYNNFDRYRYFSEAQYKDLMNKLFTQAGLEISVSEVSYSQYNGTEKQGFGRAVTFEFTTTDTETGFYETARITGEGMDKGDKAGYKADTGALKYFFAQNFWVATGDDAENDTGLNPEVKNGTEPRTETAEPDGQTEERKASPQQIKILAQTYTGAALKKLLDKNGVEKLDDLTMKKASELISKLKALKEKRGAGV